MPVVKVKNLKSEEVDEIELSDEVFGAPLNKALIYSAERGTIGFTVPHFGRYLRSQPTE